MKYALRKVRVSAGFALMATEHPFGTNYGSALVRAAINASGWPCSFFASFTSFPSIIFTAGRRAGFAGLA